MANTDRRRKGRSRSRYRVERERNGLLPSCPHWKERRTVPEVNIHELPTQITLEPVVYLLKFHPSRKCQQRHGGCSWHGSASGCHRAFLANVAIGPYPWHQGLRRGNSLQLQVIVAQRLPHQTALSCSLHSALPISSSAFTKNNRRSHPPSETGKNLPVLRISCRLDSFPSIIVTERPSIILLTLSPNASSRRFDCSQESIVRFSEAARHRDVAAESLLAANFRKAVVSDCSRVAVDYPQAATM
jgi:hypothetical protein